MRVFAALLPLLLLAAPVQAASGVRSTFATLQHCVQQRQLASCRNEVTTDSQPLYDRFTSYGLSNCLPQNARYVSEEKRGNDILVHAAAQSNRQDHRLQLAFSREAGQWKLNVPLSLELWLGENWQQRIDLAEQLYLVLRQQLGDKLDCESARALLK